MEKQEKNTKIIMLSRNNYELWAESTLNYLLKYPTIWAWISEQKLPDLEKFKISMSYGSELISMTQCAEPSFTIPKYQLPTTTIGSDAITWITNAIWQEDGEAVAQKKYEKAANMLMELEMQFSKDKFAAWSNITARVEAEIMNKVRMAKDYQKNYLV